MTKLNLATTFKTLSLGALSLLTASCNVNNTTIGDNFYPTVDLSYSNSVVTSATTQQLAGGTQILTAHLYDSNFNSYVSNLPVVTFDLDAESTGSGTFGLVIDNKDGSYSVPFTASQSGHCRVHAFADGKEFQNALDFTVLPGNFSVSASMVNISPSVITLGATAAVSLNVFDSHQNPVPGLPIAFTTFGGTSAGTFSAVVDHGNGTYTSVFTSSASGTAATIEATIAGSNVTSTPPTITVNDLAPTSLSYAASAVIYTVGTSITNNSPSSTGGPMHSYSVSPALPSGLSLDIASGVISGTPSLITSTATYTVTGTNTGGSTTASVTITVNDIAPSALTFTLNAATYTKGSAIANNSPSSAGGAIVSYSVTPALPAGLTLNTSSGVISGTPTVIAASAAYTITASNSGGSTTASITFAVNDIAPSSLAYTTSSATYTKGTAIATNSASTSGGAVVSFSISPALPAGLSLNTSSGSITGTPTTVASTASYTVTATNSGGSTTASLSFTVIDVAPSSLTYAVTSGSYLVGTAITNNSPSNMGGSALSYTVSPSLPNGLTLSLMTGMISGTPAAVTASGTYTITATNSGGNATATLTIVVNSVPTLSYASSSGTTGTYGSAMSVIPSTLTNGGLTISACGIQPGSTALPSWATVNASTCVISGTPNNTLAATSYTLIATNSAGNSTAASVSLTVNAAVPTLSYASSTGTTGGVGTTMTVTPSSLSNNGASISGCVVKSGTTALPSWATLNATTCVISGTPTAPMTTVSYTIDASNSAGISTDATVSITVNGLLDRLSVSTGAAWSLRKLRNAYTGNCIRVRRSSDSTQQDIGFVNNVLDTASLLTFVGSGTGYVVKWYDQSANGFNIAQNTTGYQPLIVTAGNVIKINSLPSIAFGGGGNTLLQATVTSVMSGIPSYTASAVVNVTGNTGDGYGRVVSLQNTGDANDFSSSASAIPILLSGTSQTTFTGFRSPSAFLSYGTITSGATAIFTSIMNGGSLTLYANGAAGTTGSNNGGVAYNLGSTMYLNIGNWATGTQIPVVGGNNDAFIGHNSETILLPSALGTTDRQLIEHEQEYFYSVSGS